MQQYPNRNELQITISDFGRGIPTNIRGKYDVTDDGHAIYCATQEGVTSQSLPTNRGAGLKTLVDYVTKNGGFVSICSMRGTVSCRRDSAGNVLVIPELNDGIYPGTLVNIVLRTDIFVGDDEEEVDFEW